MSSADDPHAFISYVHEDADHVDGLEAALEAAGIKVWRDKNNLGPGDDWKRVIRKAIQGNALAFIPCFSEAANEKDLSVMREEIHLAIEQYRLRPPDRPWILSVRFEDCEVPDYELTSTKTLTDLNWSNLFDKHYPSEIVKLVERVKLLLGTAGGPAATTAAVGDASARVRGTLIAGAVRDGVADPARSDEGDLQVRAEARKVVEGLRDRERFPTKERPDAAAMLARLQALTELTAPLIESVVALGAYGQPSRARVATDVVNSLARTAADPRGEGSIALLNFLKLPTSLLMRAGSLGAVAEQNAPMLNAFIVKPEVTTNYGPTPVHQLVTPWEPYLDDLRIADLYAKTLNGAKVDPADYDHPNRTGGEYYMAPQVALNVLMKPYLLDFTIDDTGYKELVGKTEVLTGSLVYDACGPSGGNLQYSYASNWVGLHIVDERYTQTTLADRILEEAVADGSSWWPLEGGVLFGGDPARAQTALTEYTQAAVEARTRLRF